MIVADLDKRDLISIVSGTQPDYSLIEDLSSAKYGRFSDNLGWIWDRSNLNRLREEDLWELYLSIKKPITNGN